ncbi:SDR family oxidoreductase [Antrihabitans cavernicola]|uniref:SDR family oxidoreductase n=1 Tax=Antrihabitans cavernicola TaxID=2495913 RepID=UPI001F1B0E0D|nr:SDR family oxidoreductase [Spelaeibacter cavernicola]
MTSKPLTGRIVAVTGGAQGIGKEIATHLAATGARVAIGDRDRDGARTTAAAIGGTTVGFDLDVSSRESFAAFLNAVEQEWGPVDVLVNNAGVMWVGPFDEEPEAAQRRQFDVNLHGVINGVKLAAPAMRSRGHGHIVTIASAASKLAPPGESTYAATKHAVYGYLTGVRAELRGSGVELSVIMPGVVDTELAKGTATGSAKLLQPQDVAKAVVSVIQKPRFEVTLPSYVDPALRLVNVLPRLARDFVMRQMIPNQIEATAGSSERADYESRVIASDKQGRNT